MLPRLLPELDLPSRNWLPPRLLSLLLLLERREQDPSSLLPRNQRQRSLLPRNQRQRSQLPRNQRRLPRSLQLRSQRLQRSLLPRNQQQRSLLPRSQQLRSPPRRLHQKRSKLFFFKNEYVY